MPGAGLEPARPFSQGILSLLCHSWKPSEAVDTEIRQCMLARGWKVNRRQYGSRSRVYAWRYERPNGRYGYSYRGCCYNSGPSVAGVVAATVETAGVIGSIVNSIPPSCTTVIVRGLTYQQCGSTWYQHQFVGTTQLCSDRCTPVARRRFSQM
jgi:hypothetical protein